MINEIFKFFVSFDHTWTKMVNFGQNWSSRAGKLTGSLFSFDGRSEKKWIPRWSAEPPGPRSRGFCWHCLLIKLFVYSIKIIKFEFLWLKLFGFFFHVLNYIICAIWIAWMFVWNFWQSIGSHKKFLVIKNFMQRVSY